MVNRTVPASVHRTLVNAFKGTVNLKRIFWTVIGI